MLELALASELRLLDKRRVRQVVERPVLNAHVTLHPDRVEVRLDLVEHTRRVRQALRLGVGVGHPFFFFLRAVGADAVTRSGTA